MMNTTEAAEKNLEIIKKAFNKPRDPNRMDDFLEKVKIDR